MSFCMTALNQDVETKQICVILIQTVHWLNKKEDIYKDITKDIETRFDTSNYELHKPLDKEKPLKNNWINERWVSWKNYINIC